jgi:hypothetical protein
MGFVLKEMEMKTITYSSPLIGLSMQHTSVGGGPPPPPGGGGEGGGGGVF